MGTTFGRHFGQGKGQPPKNAHKPEQQPGPAVSLDIQSGSYLIRRADESDCFDFKSLICCQHDTSDTQEARLDSPFGLPSIWFDQNGHENPRAILADRRIWRDEPSDRVDCVMVR